MVSAPLADYYLHDTGATDRRFSPIPTLKQLEYLLNQRTGLRLLSSNPLGHILGVVGFFVHLAQSSIVIDQEYSTAHKGPPFPATEHC